MKPDPRSSCTFQTKLSRIIDEKHIHLLDCTIRDGSYVLDFQWSEAQIESIAGALAEGGVEYIEVGHGLGLGASAKTTKAKCSDRNTIRAAVRAKKESKIGAFFIPGIGERKHLDLLMEEGGSFVRIGSNATSSETAIPYIEHAKKLGLEVAYNFMKSYVLTPFQMCVRASSLVEAGADIIYVVDSAGAMLPSQVARYISPLVEQLRATVGFHGHNNLLLANANTLSAVEAGATFADATLLGIGRGAGNAQTESMLVILRRAGFSTAAEPMRLAKASTEHILHLSDGLKGSETFDLLCGYSYFHDGFMGMVERTARRYSVDTERLVIEVSKLERENPSKDLIERIARDIRDQGAVSHFPSPFYDRED